MPEEPLNHSPHGSDQNQRWQESIVQFIAAFLFSFSLVYFLLFLALVMCEATSWRAIILPAIIVGIAGGIWKEKFLDGFVKILSWIATFF